MTESEKEKLVLDEARARRARRLLIGAGLAICAIAVVGLVGAVVNYLVNQGQDTTIRNVHNDVTRFEKSACAKDPTRPSAKCEEIRQALARNESIVGACIQHQRVTGEKGRNCPRLFVDVADHGGPQPTSPGSPAGSDAPRSPSSATQPAAPNHPAHTGTGTNGHDGKTSPQPSPGTTATGSPAGQAPSSSPTSPSSDSSITTEVEPEPAPAAEPESHPPVESIVAPVTGTVETATGKACEVTGLLCSK